MLFAGVLLAGLVLDRPADAGGGPQNVVLVVNPDDPDSLAVANAYVELRGVPASNIVHVPWKVDVRSTTGPALTTRLIKPVLDELRRRGVAAQIDILAFSSGFPYLIDCAPMFPGQQLSRQARPMTSLTTAAYMYQFLAGNRVEMFSMNANLYFTPTIDGRTESRAFSASQLWGAGGQAVSAGGVNYLLSTALGVTHGQGNEVEEIVASLRRAKAADGTKPKGTIYYMRNKDVRSRARDATYAAAVAELAAVGVSGVVEQGVVPRNKADVAGLTTGAAIVPLRSSGSTLLPGALVDNFTSSGGRLMNPSEPRPQTRISEYIRLGAAGASGCVVEPFAIAAKFPSAALHVHYARGCSLAESFYQSIAAPCHQLIIGDPLCQPWAVPPQITVAGTPEGDVLSGELALTPTAKYPDGRTAARFELYLDGVRSETIEPGGKFSLKTGELADGWHDIRVVAIDDTPIAVQGHWGGVYQVKNGRDSLQLTIAEARMPLSGTVTVQAASTADGEITVKHLGRPVGTVAPGGQLRIDATELGTGRPMLQGEQTGEPALRSRPITVEIY